MLNKVEGRRSRWPSGLRRGSAATRLLGLRVRIQLGAWMSVSCVCCLMCRYRLVRRNGHSSRGVLLSVCVCEFECACVCKCVCVNVSVCM